MINLTNYITIIGVLTLIVNVCTEVFKKFLTDKYTQVFVILFSIALTVISFIAYCQITNIKLVWYYFGGALIGGVFVAFSAMYGFDKLKEMIDKYIKKE